MQLIELFRYDFMRHALISEILLGPTCALLGVFVNLRGMAFFSDALAHSALTGVALGFMIDAATGWNLDPTIYVLIFFLTQLRPLTLATLDPELARARGTSPALLHYAFSLLVAATVAVSLKMLGALLLSALIVVGFPGAWKNTVIHALARIPQSQPAAFRPSHGSPDAPASGFSIACRDWAPNNEATRAQSRNLPAPSARPAVHR